MRTVIGSKRIPISRLPVLLKDADRLYEINKNQAFPVKKMIEDLGSNPRSSSVPTKIPDLKSFGLLEGNYKGLRITELGQKVLQIDNTQRSIFLDKIVRNIRLWDVFQNNGGNDITTDTVIRLLIQETGVSEGEARERAIEIKNAFLQDVKCITDFEPQQRSKLTFETPQTQGQNLQESPVKVPLETTEIPLAHVESHVATLPQKPQIDVTIMNPKPAAAKTQIEQIVQPTYPSKEIEPSVQTKTETNSLEEESKSPGKITIVSQDLIGLAKYLPSTEKITIEFGSVKFELRDESSIALAKVLIQVKENGLLQREDYEQK
jgi:hypothetical protein